MALTILKNGNGLNVKQGLVSFLKNGFLSLYYGISDRQVNDLSVLNAEKAVKYLERLDITKENAYLILRSSLKHSNRQVVFQTISILKENRTINSRKLINTLLNSKDQEVVIAAIDALRLFRSNDIVKPLAGCLIRKDKNIALAALWTLAEIKTPESIEAIEKVLDFDNEDLQKTALWILKGVKSSRGNSKKVASV